jgi:stalled ribosome rescue protein Dom34
MSTKVGLWIDHRKAIVVAVTEKGEETIEITSDAEKQLRRSGDLPLEGAYESRQMPADDKRQRAFTGQLNNYYDAVIEEVRDADSILIFGPGEAKNELKERLVENNLSERIVGIETVDKMTNPQIAAKTRKYFADQHSLIASNQET